MSTITIIGQCWQIQSEGSYHYVSDFSVIQYIASCRKGGLVCVANHSCGSKILLTGAEPKISKKKY